MNQKLMLSLLAIPMLTGSMLTMMVMPLAVAAETIASFQKDVFSDELTLCSVPGNEGRSAKSVPLLQKQATIASANEQAINPPLEYPVLDFSEAESDAAVTLFGCDCPACINSLRQLRNQPIDQLVLRSQRMTQPTSGHKQAALSGLVPVSASVELSQNGVESEPIVQSNPFHSTQGHCWDNLRRRATLEDVQNVLQTLEAEERLQ